MTRLRTVWMQELRWPEVEAYLARCDIALVPIGATEQHGRHLPMLVDTGWAEAASLLAAQQADVVVAPPLPFGWSPHHMGYPGTITLGADTLRAVTRDICNSLIYHGFKRIVIVNGNRIANLQPLEIAAVELINRSGAHVIVADTGLIARREVKALCELGSDGLDHAGEAESAFALHWAGEHVDMNAASPPLARNAAREPARFDYPTELDPALNGNALSRFVTPQRHRAATAPDGTMGDPSSATADKGRAMIEAIAAALVDVIEEVRAADVGQTRVELPV